MSEPDRVIDFPDGWGTGKPIDHIQGIVPGTRDPKGVYVFGTLLDDGSNLFALVYPGGHRFARTAASLRWGIEERLGPDPEPAFQQIVAEQWQAIINLMVDAGHQTDVDLRAMGLPSSRKRPQS
jgi:hypothetical protein